MQKQIQKLSKALCVTMCAAIFVPAAAAHAQTAPADVALDAGAISDSGATPGDAAPIVAKKKAPGALSDKTIEEAPVEAAAELVSSIREGDWRKTAALVLSLTMLGFARFRKNLGFLSGKRAGVLTIFGLSTVGALTTSLLGSAPVDYLMFTRALEIGLYAIGGYVGIKNLVWPNRKAA